MVGGGGFVDDTGGRAAEGARVGTARTGYRSTIRGQAPPILPSWKMIAPASRATRSSSSEPRVVEHIDVVRHAGRVEQVVQRKPAGHIGRAAVYPRTGDPLEYFGLKFRGSHFRISPTRLNAAMSPFFSISVRTCSNCSAPTGCSGSFANQRQVSR